MPTSSELARSDYGLPNTPHYYQQYVQQVTTNAVVITDGALSDASQPDSPATKLVPSWQRRIRFFPKLDDTL
jgi:hypothetical protein